MKDYFMEDSSGVCKESEASMQSMLFLKHAAPSLKRSSESIGERIIVHTESQN